MKVFTKDEYISANSDFTMLKNEIKIQRALKMCSNVVKIHEIFENQNEIYIIMDF